MHFIYFTLFLCTLFERGKCIQLAILYRRTNIIFDLRYILRYAKSTWWNYCVIHFWRKGMVPPCRAADCGFVHNATADVSQIRMTRGLRTTYITREIRSDTLLISRLSRFSGDGRRLCRWEESGRSQIRVGKEWRTMTANEDIVSASS